MPKSQVAANPYVHAFSGGWIVAKQADDGKWLIPLSAELKLMYGFVPGTKFRAGLLVADQLTDRVGRLYDRKCDAVKLANRTFLRK